MEDFFQYLSNPNFMPHGHCYLWQPDILWTHVISDLVIALSYYAIPFFLALFLYKNRDSYMFNDILGLFIAFIFLCGTTHLFKIYVTWYPAYEFEGWLKAITAMVSLTTALVLAPRVPKLMGLHALEKDYENNLRTLQRLEAEKGEMQALVELATNREDRIIELKNEINTLLEQQNQPPKYQHGAPTT